LTNTNAGISYAQLLSISPLLRKMCAKGLKLNPYDVRQLKVMLSLEENDTDTDNSDKDTEHEIKDDKHVYQLYKIKKDKVDIAIVIGFIYNNLSKVLIDTGSGVNVIKREFYEKMVNKPELIHTSKALFINLQVML